MPVEKIIERLQTIFDPEIPVNIYDLGLIYEVRVIGDQAHILMTLTAASCPAAAFLPEEVRAAVAEVPGISDAHVTVTYEPRWTQERMSPQARAALGFA